MPQKFPSKKRKVAPSAVPKKHYDDMAAKVLAQEVSIHGLMERVAHLESQVLKLAARGAVGPGFEVQ